MGMYNETVQCVQCVTVYSVTVYSVTVYSTYCAVTIRQAIYASATFPGIPGWRAWLCNRPSSRDKTSRGYLDDEDLLIMFTGIGGLVTAHTVAVLNAVDALGCRGLYFVDVAHWKRALGGMEAGLLIPILCIILYGYEVYQSDIKAHTVLLYLLFCLTYMYRT